MSCTTPTDAPVASADTGSSDLPGKEAAVESSGESRERDQSLRVRSRTRHMLTELLNRCERVRRDQFDAAVVELDLEFARVSATACHDA